MCFSFALFLDSAGRGLVNGAMVSPLTAAGRPFVRYTDIQPGGSVTVHYQFTGGGEKGERISLAHDMAYRFATAEKDAALSDTQKLKAVRFGCTISFEL
jgi:hypothetical protein